MQDNGIERLLASLERQEENPLGGLTEADMHGERDAEAARRMARRLEQGLPVELKIVA